MSIDGTVTTPQSASPDAPQDQVVVDQAVDQVVDDPAPAEVEELLVEEVSIDGMCGVY